MKNILSREEFLNQQMNEGFVDTIKRGFNKVKNFIKFHFGKIKNMIVVFGSNGKVLPVITPAAIIDQTAGSRDIQVYASPEMHEFVKNIGGKTDGLTTIPLKKSKEDDYGCFIKKKESKDTVEYRNYKILLKTLEGINESIKSDYAESDMIDEGFKETTQRGVRLSYTASDTLNAIEPITYKQLKEKLIDELTPGVGRYKNSNSRGRYKLNKPILIFGASGIGKSSIFDAIADVYNKNKDRSKKISLIHVGCDTLGSDNWFMPVLPKDDSVAKYIQDHPEEFTSKTEIDGETVISQADMDKLNKIFSKATLGTARFKAPKWWPSYEDAGNKEANEWLDNFANGAREWGGEDADRPQDGGFIIFDEFLRMPDQEMFQSFMNLLTDRAMQGFILGSRWVLVFCANRPDDDDLSNERYRYVQRQPALADRLRIMQVEPDIPTWKKWAFDKGFDPAIIHFIFENVDEDPNNKDTESKRINKIAYSTNKTTKDEYARWHTMSKGEGGQVNQITPRDWEKVAQNVNIWKASHENLDWDDFLDLDDDAREKILSKYSLYQMPKDYFYKMMKGQFDDDFIDIFWDWIEEQKTAVKLKDIMEDPEKTKLPDSIKDITSMKSCLENLIIQFGDNFEKDPKLCTDEKLSNIFLWMGQKFVGKAILVRDDFVNLLENKGLSIGTEDSLVSHQNACYMLYAAFPPEVGEEDKQWGAETVEDNIKIDFTYNNFKDKDAVKKVQELAQKYFPWNWDDEKKCLIPWNGVTKDVFGQDKDGNDLI
jgi:hypothetical protein